ncbi:MAG TPA: DUF92 domain-containing protein [Thermomicrobiales bacterium]|jgi:uncharacterized protein (TIGR00297 family)
MSGIALQDASMRPALRAVYRAKGGGNPSPLRAPQPSLLPTPHAIVTGLAASTAIGTLAYRRGSLTKSGVAGAILTGTTIFAAGGTVPAALLVTFFVSSSALSLWRRGRKTTATTVEAAKGERRDLAQALANGGAAAALVALGRIAPASPWFPALVGALATTNADTWATEIGLSNRQPPRLITTLQPVTPGTSGGVSPLGTAAAAGGAALIGAVAALGTTLTRQRQGVSGWVLLPVSVVSGVGGAFADSLLGATVQARYRCPQCDLATERAIHRCGTPTIFVGGLRLVDNDVVNFLASLSGAMLGVLCARIGARRMHGGGYGGGC